MTAGMVRVPTIVPLRPPSNSRKNMIDTQTPIEILSAKSRVKTCVFMPCNALTRAVQKAETAGALIYYTVNGTKPNPFQKIGEKFTYRYYKPFVLGPGKKTVKAMATSSDGTRESSIVTKMFLVEEAVQERRHSEDEMSEEFQGKHEYAGNISNSMKGLSLSKSRSMSMEPPQNGWTNHDDEKRSTNSGLRKSRGDRFGRREEVQSPEYLSLLLDRSYGGSFQDGRDRGPPEAEFTKCIYCFAPRPSDPYSTYCNDCGSLLPQPSSTRLPPPHSEKLALCKICHSMVPLNAPTCVVCEAAMSPQRIPKGSPRSPDKLVCDVCDTVNPVDMTRCTACESQLPLKSKQVPSKVSAPPLPKEYEALITCSSCFRVNSGEARFCDWCGSKPVPYTSYLTCSRCSGNNQPYSKYCSSCACHIDSPPRTSKTDSVLGTLVEKGKVREKLSSSKLTTWIPVDVPRLSCETANQATQTGGLFYPSSTSLNKQQKMEADERARIEHLRDRKPLLGAVSPGRGYWRQQMDHICSHLRAHAQNNPEFRAIIGEPRIGKLVATTVHEDFEGEELTLTVTFTRRQTDNAHSKSNLPNKDTSSTRIGKKLDLEASSSSVGSSGSQGKKKTPKRNTKKKPAVNKSKETVLSSETRSLFKELGKSGEGSPEEIERLISEGADVNAENADGVTVLIMAVLHNHIDCIPLLVNEGAELNHQSASKGNTALHEAVLQGSNARQCIDVLLGCGADTKLMNKAGESAYDLAVKSGNESIIEKFTTNLGQELLQKLTKTKTPS